MLPQSNRSALEVSRPLMCPHPDQLCEGKEIGPTYEGAGPGPDRWWKTVGGSLSCPISFLFEACTQVALNVDFGRARGPECQAGF